MIRRFLLLCKSQLKKTASADLYTFTDEDYPDLSSENCPICHARGEFHGHGSYERYVIDLQHGKPVVLHVVILRVKCSCGHTHALLKDSLIPYCQYSLRFVLHVLKAYFRHSRTVAQICRDFQISTPTLYRWKHLFLQHRELWTGLLRSREQSALFFLSFLDRLARPSRFLHSFYQKTTFSFLQSHANPAYS